jgi:multidrug efflux pump
MILGALSLIMASGVGAVSRRQMGLVIVGGMSIGTLFVVPVAYYLIASKKTKII